MIDLSSENSSTVADWIEALAASQSGKPLSMQKVQEISESFANVGQNVIPFAFRLLEKRNKFLKTYIHLLLMMSNVYYLLLPLLKCKRITAVMFLEHQTDGYKLLPQMPLVELMFTTGMQ